MTPPPSQEPISAHPDGVLVRVKLQPRASSNIVVGVEAGELKIKVNAPPVDGAANQALVEFLSEELDCAKSGIRLIRGQTSRHKQIVVVGAEVSAVKAILLT